LTDLTERFGQALVFAFQLHNPQWRKGSQTPYIAHPLGVASLVLEDGGDEDEAIAALLHDAAEDQGGLETLEQIRGRFGERVASIVDGCTDTYETPKPPWRQRKIDYIAHLRAASPSIWRVSLADKLHNGRAILADLRSQGEQVWQRFNGGKSGSLWYYRNLAQVFRELNSSGSEISPMVFMLDEVVTQIEQLAGAEQQ
jgi:(p)ppGpp synthase/HD superfamily hydrolase